MNLASSQSISLWSPSFALQMVTVGPLPPGTNVLANASVSMIDTLFVGNNPDPTFAGEAFIWSWTTYEPDGSQSGQQSPDDFFQNSIQIDNCATVTFSVAVERVWVYALLNVFSL